LPYGKNELTPLELCRARSVLRQRVAAMLRGHRLEVRELATALAISNPAEPDKGSIHIGYVSGDASLKRTTWTFLGSLPGYESNDDPDREPAVDAATIIGTLTGQGEPSP
jgi:hypothetical protein